MDEDEGEPKKIVRITPESLVVKPRADEETYRRKYLPDPTKLPDEKLVCTVCSKSLAQVVHAGKDIFPHKSLLVLVCEECCVFFGNGCFSTDEDGDDKYCRWCGQGGTLFLCSACTCGFCKKCTKRNLKPSALAELERDDWKCLICVPRPIYGLRAIFWAARHLNNIGKEKEKGKRRMRAEKLKILAEEKKSPSKTRKSPATTKYRNGKDESITTKRKHDDEDSDSSTISIPYKKHKNQSANDKNLNGSLNKSHRSSSDTTSDDERSEKKLSFKKEKKKIQKYKASSSEEETPVKQHKHNEKKKTKYTSESSTDNETRSPNHKHHVKRKRKKQKDTASSSDDTLERRKKKNKRKDRSDTSTDRETHKVISKKVHNKKHKRKERLKHDEELSLNSDSEKKQHIKVTPSKSDVPDEENKMHENIEKEENIICNDSLDIVNDVKPVEQDSDETLFDVSQVKVEDEKTELTNGNDLNNSGTEVDQAAVSESDLTAVPLESTEEIPLDTTDIDPKENTEQTVKAAITWLCGIVGDISEIGGLIAKCADDLFEKKMNLDSCKSYDDVLLNLDKVKQFMDGIHQNYNQLESNLDAKLSSWKVVAGLEEIEKEQAPEEEQVIETSEENKENSINAAQESNNVDESTDQNNVQPNSDNNTADNLEKTPGEESVGETLLAENVVKTEIPDKESEDGVENNLTELNTGDKSDELGCTITSTDADNEITTPTPVVEDGVKEDLVQIKNEVEINETEMPPEDETNRENGVDDAVLSDKENKDGGETIENKEQSEQEVSISNGVPNSIPDGVEESVKENGEAPEANHKEGSPNNLDSMSNKALQELLYSSSDDEVNQSDSDSDESEELELDDSDLEIKKPKKSLSKKSVDSKKPENKLTDKTEPQKCKVKKDDKIKNEETVKIEHTVEKEDIEIKEENGSEKEEIVDVNDKVEDEREVTNDEEVDEESQKKESKKAEEDLDSEAEIDMLVDLTKLKKKMPSRKLASKESSEEDDINSEESESGDSDDGPKSSKQRKKYKNESKKRREEEREELFGFLEGNSSNEDGELDVTEKDLDVLKDQYSSSDSMSLEEFSKRMNAKWKELEKQQDQMNLEMLLASDSDEGPVEKGDSILESEEDNKKKKKGNKNKIKEEKNDTEEVDEKDKEDEKEITVKKEKDNEQEEEDKDSDKIETDDEYEQFMEGIVNSRTEFKGLGSSSDQSDQDNDVTIKDEPGSDDAKSKKESKSQSDDSSASDSDDSGDLFMDKKKSLKKKSWRSHRLFRIKLSDTDTSDEERWWKRKLEKEQKKKEERGGLDRPTKSLSAKSKSEDSGSDKENKKKWKKKAKSNPDEEDGSSTMELSSTESSGSDIFKRKKKKKKSSTDSDIKSDEDNKKKKKKKKRGSSDESNDSDDDVIDITQKSSQGESPGKGGRKNIRKVLTKHELAAATKAAAKEEEERRKRIAARQKQYNEMFEIKEAEILEKLVLDFDPDTKTELISVDKDLVGKMKPHQAKGVKFMWDSCFESLTQLKTKKGSGCILAHCMGLGKTFQVISLVHTILKHEDTRVRTVLVVCPLSTVLNWASEFRKWLDDVDRGKEIRTYHFTTCRRPHERAMRLQEWQRKGGVMILGYEMFRMLTNEVSKKFRLTHRNIYQNTLIDPGADLVVCDEGHMLKNESTVLSKAMSRIKTLRRIVLTGTPMQNNLKEYHCMVQFVKPNLLGTRKEFLNQFVNPITNGQFVDSTEGDVKVMKRRSHVLHKMLEGLVQRFDYTVLTPFLPPKHEYVVSLRLSEVQVKLYQFYLKHFSQLSGHTHSGSKLFPDWQALGRIWTHPRVLKMSTEKAEREREKKRQEEETEEEGEEGSIKAFIDDRSSLSVSSSGSSSSSDIDDDSDKSKKKKKPKPTEKKKEEVKVPDQQEIEINLISSDEEEVVIKSTEEEEKAIEENLDSENKNEEGKSDKEIKLVEGEEKSNSKGEDESKEETEKEAKVDEVNTKNEEDKKTDSTKKSEVKELMDSKSAWWKPLIEPEHLDDINQSAKLIMLFAILRECEMIEDKVLVFSQSLFSLDLIEYFLKKVDEATEESRLEESLGNHVGSWTKGLDYFRLDGSSSSENRSSWCKSFNREDNPRARLFLISTRAGGLGINLTAANRVVIFDASWNPSHDVQSIFRIYRFGQKKPCYIYRFIASGTMEEKVYDRQVAKQSLSSRVIDEQQVHRHFSSHDLTELYKFTPPAPRGERPTPSLPKDRLMAELLTQYSDWIEKYHEHDSLLENVVEEELNEEERKLAWEDYENDKKQGFLPAPGVGNFQTATTLSHEELFRKSLRIKYPTASEPELNAMLQTLMFQVNSNKFVNISQLSQQNQQIQTKPSTSQVGVTPNFRMPNAISNTQQFVNMRNRVYQNYGQYAQPNMGKRMGNGEIKKQAQNLMNAQSNVNNMDPMRRQQEAELARVKRQQAMGSLAQSSAQLNNIYQNNRQNLQTEAMKQRQLQTQSVNNRHQSRQTINNRQQQPQAAGNGRRHNQWPVQPVNSAQQRQPIQNTQANNRGFQNKNTIHSQNQRKQSVANRFVNNKSLQVIPVNQKQSERKTDEQIRKEIVSRIQHQRQLAERQKEQARQATAAAAIATPTYKRQLEDMKNRYKASRTKLGSSSSPIIVEIDDDPVEPSGSAS